MSTRQLVVEQYALHVDASESLAELLDTMRTDDRGEALAYALQAAIDGRRVFAALPEDRADDVVRAPGAGRR